MVMWLGYVWCAPPRSWPSLFLAMCILPPRSFTHIASMSLPAPQGQNTQSDRTNISFLGIVVTLHGQGMCCTCHGCVRVVSHLGSARPCVPLALSGEHPNPCLRQPSSSATHTCPPAPRLLACHDRHARVTAKCPPSSLIRPKLIHPNLPMCSSPRFPTIPPHSTSPVRSVSHLHPEHVFHTSCVSRETHSYPCSSLTSPTLHFSITCSAPHTPPTAPVRRSEALSPPTPPNSTPTPLQGPHRAFRGSILKMAATSATSTVMSHTIRPKNVLNSRQKPCRPFRADFTPCGVLG